MLRAAAQHTSCGVMEMHQLAGGHHQQCRVQQQCRAAPAALPVAAAGGSLAAAVPPAAAAPTAAAQWPLRRRRSVTAAAANSSKREDAVSASGIRSSSSSSSGGGGGGSISGGSTSPTTALVDQSVEEAVHIVEESLHERAALCDSGLPDPDMCLIPEAEEEPPAELPVWNEALTRGRWLLGLLVLQSTSSFVLDSYQDLLRDHLVVTLFLTMLVGAGGNAGNQSAIKVIRGLATGSITTSWKSIRDTMTEQLEVAMLLGGGLSAAGFVRVYVTNGSLLNAFAISVSLLAIVFASVLLGTGLPFALARGGVDPAHAGTSIQVLMDIMGVLITCVTCQAVLVQFADSLPL